MQKLTNAFEVAEFTFIPDLCKWSLYNFVFKTTSRWSSSCRLAFGKIQSNSLCVRLLGQTPIDLIDFNPNGSEAGAPAHLGGHLHFKRHWGCAASHGGALTLVSCAKGGIPSTVICTLTSQNAQVQTGEGKNAQRPSLGKKKTEGAKTRKTFSAGFPQPPPSHPTSTHTEAWQVSSGDPVSASPPTPVYSLVAPPGGHIETPPGQ